MYRAREVKATLAAIRRHPIPPSTWAYWKKRLQINATGRGVYTQEQFEILKGLVKALNRDWTIDEYIDWLIAKDSQNNDNSDRQTEASKAEPIEVTATAIC